MRKYFLIIPLFLLFFVLPVSASNLGNPTNSTSYCSTSQALSFNGVQTGSAFCCDANTDEILGGEGTVNYFQYFGYAGSDYGIISNLCTVTASMNFRVIKDNDNAMDTACSASDTCGECITALGATDYYDGLISGGLCYSRTPAGANVGSPVTITASVTNYEKWGLTDPSVNYIQIGYDEDGAFTYYSNQCYPKTTLDFTDTTSLAVGSTIQNVMLVGFANIEDCSTDNWVDSVNLEGDGGSTVIFTVIQSPANVLRIVTGSALNSSTNIATTVISTYWPYILIISIIFVLIAIFARFVIRFTKK